jgi:DNA polymerase/3'-5' exonuclease PolX
LYSIDSQIKNKKTLKLKQFFMVVAADKMQDYKAIILSELETMKKADIARKKPFQARAYAKAMNEISSLDKPILSVKDVEGLPGVGKKIQEKVSEILSTGSLRAAKEARAEVSLDAMDVLQKVHGIGPVKARQLIEEHNIKTLEQLRKAVKDTPGLLNDVQMMGLKYADDAELRIPRAEMVEHEAKILKALDKRFQGVVVGSYRRGAVDSGDIDVLLSLPNTMSEKEQGKLFLDTIKQLKETYIVDSLAQGPKKFLGYVRLSPDHPVRRLDLLMTPQVEFPYAILYFTGSQKFNVAFRKYALQKGYTINEHTMKPTKTDVPEPPVLKTEEDVFAFLGLKYVVPDKRVGEKDIQPVSSELSQSMSTSRSRKGS